MQFGGGKYGEPVSALLDSIGAAAVVVLVIDGPEGDGYAAAYRPQPPERAAQLVVETPAYLRQVADRLSRDLDAIEARLRGQSTQTPRGTSDKRD